MADKVIGLVFGILGFQQSSDVASAVKDVQHFDTVFDGAVENAVVF